MISTKFKKTVKIDKLDEIPFDIELLSANGKVTDKQISKLDFGEILKSYFIEMDNTDFTIQEKISFQQELLGYTSIQIDTDKKNCYVSDIIKHPKFPNSHPRIVVMSLNTGKVVDAKIDSKYLALSGVMKGCLVKVHSSMNKPISFKDENNKWQTVPNKKQLWLTNIEVIQEREL